MTPPHLPRLDAPPTLTVAASAVGLEVIGYAVLGVVELAAFDSKRPEVALSTGLAFVLLAGFLGFCAWRLWRLDAWARAPIVMTQLIQVPVAFNFWGDGWTKVVTIVLLLVSAVVLVGIFHPRSLAAFEGDE
ncbi:MAG TPA: hypothetical protein VLI04_01170 [Nocardioidaceae bacterium]|nr:hypothetical protein [Nocardioidaceae bacterium]